MTTSPILIAGAGIGGLTAALALHARGLEVTVLERASELRDKGVGINLLPHAVRELSALDLGSQLTRIAVAPHSIDFVDHRGALLFREPRGIDGGYGHPQLSVHRGRLQMLLLEAVRDRLGADSVRTGTPVLGFTQSDRGVRVDTPAGSVTGSVLIGADGIGSAVRKAIVAGPDPFLSSGITMFRGAARMRPFLDGRTMAIVKGPAGLGLVTYPIGDDLVNWVLQVPTGEPGPLDDGQASWNAPARADQIRPYIAGWDLGWLDVDELIDRTDDIFSYPMVDKDPLPHWGSGRVTLLGDAAHPMYPVGANGGSQSIVDAAVLADELVEHGPAGLDSYQRLRRPETAEVVTANRDMHTAAEQSSSDLAQITATYRNNTARSSRS